MAASNRAARPRKPSSVDDDGVGIAHLTVVPTNFDPDAPGNRRD